MLLLPLMNNYILCYLLYLPLTKIIFFFRNLYYFYYKLYLNYIILLRPNYLHIVKICYTSLVYIYKLRFWLPTLIFSLELLQRNIRKLRSGTSEEILNQRSLLNIYNPRVWRCFLNPMVWTCFIKKS